MDDLVKEIDIVDDHDRPVLFAALRSILVWCFTISLWLPVSLCCLPLFILGLAVWGLPPVVPAWPAFRKYFVAVFMEGKSNENIPFTNRVLLFLITFDTMIKAPIQGVCWYIDELLYSSYHKVYIKDPVFMMTAFRSGSTQLCDFLQDDIENFISPTVAEASFPYIWVWKLFVPILVKLGVDKMQFHLFGAEANKRHTLVLLKTDAIDGMLRQFHFGMNSTCLGSSFMCWGFSFAKLNEPIYEGVHKSLVLYTNIIMKKVMYYRGKPKQRMLVKGHFLINAVTFEQQYPKGKFFTLIRDPVSRLPSLINLLKVLVADGPGQLRYGLFPASWRVLRDYSLRTQIPYCEQEMSFYRKPADNKLVIPFTVYVNNLTATLQRIYSFCNIPIPDHVMPSATRRQNTTHNFTKLKSSYDPKFNIDLASLGVDEKKLRERLREYYVWMNSLEHKKAKVMDYC